jgi:hypothetical protein
MLVVTGVGVDLSMLTGRGDLLALRSMVVLMTVLTHVNPPAIQFVPPPNLRLDERGLAFLGS